MEKGYSINKNGVVHQDSPTPIKYDKNYISSRYVTYPLSQTLSYLRLGFILGSGSIPHSICDVGYGNGDFLSACANIISVRAGIEVNGWDLPSGCIPGNYQDYYDIFTFYDSLEHFTDIDFLADLDCKYLVITVPSCNYPEDDAWFRNWKHRRFNEHICHFNAESLENQMFDYGYY